MKYTYGELIEMLESSGCNLADMAVGRMMDIVEEQTGKFPDYDDVVPDWVVRNCMG